MRDKGNWQVTRFCCISGMCIDCHKRGNRRVRIVHISNISKEFAVIVAKGWSSYDAKVEPMDKDKPSS